MEAMRGVVLPLRGSAGLALEPWVALAVLASPTATLVLSLRDKSVVFAASCDS
jgi:hypothetical protein